MVVTKRKKVVKYRGHTTHGGGHRKKRRGAGSRGGRGNAGSGKRAGQKKAGGLTLAGRNGFNPRRMITSLRSVNLSYFTQDRLNKLLAAKKVTKEGETYNLDLKKLGYQKLLGTGTTTLKLKVTVSLCSAKAMEKVQAAGGQVLTTVKSEGSEE